MNRIYKIDINSQETTITKTKKIIENDDYACLISDMIISLIITGIVGVVSSLVINDFVHVRMTSNCIGGALGFLTFLISVVLMVKYLEIQTEDKTLSYATIPHTLYGSDDALFMIDDNGNPMTSTYDMASQIHKANKDPKVARRLHELFQLKADICEAYRDHPVETKHADLLVVDMEIHSLLASAICSAENSENRKMIAQQSDVQRRVNALVNQRHSAQLSSR